MLSPSPGFRGIWALLLVPFMFTCDGSTRAQDPESARRPSGRPNVLIVLTDDQAAWGTMHVLRKTRRIFEREGTRYANAVATTPVCCPSRASIFSGRYVHNHGVRNNDVGSNLDHEMTIQHELRRDGYETAIVGKFLNHWTGAPPYFDHWAIFERGYEDTVFDVDGSPVRVEYSTTFIRDQALELIDDFEAEDRRPWMLLITPYAPHITSQKNREGMVEDRYRAADVGGLPQTPAKAETNTSDKPQFLKDSPGNVDYFMGYYKPSLRSLLSVDDLVGDVFGRLEDLDEADDTLAFFASDNGYIWGEHGLIKKNLPYDESVRIPFYVRWPGHAPPGKTDRRIVANVDIAPTVFEAAGLDPAYAVDGRDIYSSHRDAILLENFSVPRHPDIPSWKARWTPRSLFVEWKDPHMLEHYGRRDPWQLDNTYADVIGALQPARETSLLKWLQRASLCSGTSCP